jgi:vancomycin resistance protein YoaR
MATEETDLVDEVPGLTPGKAAGRPAVPEAKKWESSKRDVVPPASSAVSTASAAVSTASAAVSEASSPASAAVSTASAAVSVAPKPKLELLEPVVAAEPKRRRGGRAVRFAVAFAVGTIATLVLLTAVAVAAFSATSNRVVPGVHVGSVDVSGLNRDQVIARLQTSYAYLGDGEASVNTPVGAAPITYRETGRAPDVEVMADAAMSVGHTGNAIDDAVSMLRSAVGGRSLPVIVQIDPTAVATSVRRLVGTNQVLAQDARVTVQNGTFVVVKATPGSGLDEQAISAAIIDRLMQPDATANVRVDDTFVELGPKVTSQDAQDAIAAAQKMITDVNLTWGGLSPATFKVDAQTVRSWLVFGFRVNGTYGPAADPVQVQAYLSRLSAKVGTPPVEPSVMHNKAGQATSLKGGKDGIAIDSAATWQAIEAYLEGLASGRSPASAVAIITEPILPTTTLTSLKGTVILGGGKGSWTTVFNPDISNGNGANIRIPAKLLNGQVVQPGEQFSFLKAMGTIDEAHGFAMGGVIASGKSDHTGAIGGGICSASTTMFNAAARAGLQIDERHAHFYYITRYPIGLDATVFVSGSQRMDLQWTNDTPNPIVIRAYTTPGAKSTIVVELWSQPLDRTVVLSAPYRKNVVPASDSTKFTTRLKPGVWGRADFPSDGYDTSRIRTVTDSTGKVIHRDLWLSKYRKVDGLLLIGKSI